MRNETREGGDWDPDYAGKDNSEWRYHVLAMERNWHGKFCDHNADDLAFKSSSSNKARFVRFT